MEYLKCQHMMKIQRALNNIARHLNVRTPIVVTSCLIKLTLALGFCLDHRDNLGTCPHLFGMIQHTSSARKVLNAHTNQHQVI